MTVKVSDAYVLLGVPSNVSREEAMRAVDKYVETFVHMNEPSMATRAFEAFGIIAAERNWMTQAQADVFVTRMSARVLSMSADIDQRHAELARLGERRDELVKRRDALEKRYDKLTGELSESAGPIGPILASIARLFRPSRRK